MKRAFLIGDDQERLCARIASRIGERSRDDHCDLARTSDLRGVDFELRHLGLLWAQAGRLVRVLAIERTDAALLPLLVRPRD